MRHVSSCQFTEALPAPFQSWDWALRSSEGRCCRGGFRAHLNSYACSPPFSRLLPPLIAPSTCSSGLRVAHKEQSGDGQPWRYPSTSPSFIGARVCSSRCFSRPPLPLITFGRGCLSFFSLVQCPSNLFFHAGLLADMI